MTYLRLLRVISNTLRWAMARCDSDGWLWADIADRDGRVALRQIAYVKRVQKASGWEPVQLTTPYTWVWPGWTATTAANNSGLRVNGVPVHDA